MATEILQSFVLMVMATAACRQVILGMKLTSGMTEWKGKKLSDRVGDLEDCINVCCQGLVAAYSVVGSAAMVYCRFAIFVLFLVFLLFHRYFCSFLGFLGYFTGSTSSYLINSTCLQQTRMMPTGIMSMALRLPRPSLFFSACFFLEDLNVLSDRLFLKQYHLNT